MRVDLALVWYPRVSESYANLNNLSDIAQLKSKADL